MKKTVYLSDFARAFHDSGRGNQFSHEGLECIFNHFKQYEQDTGEEMELDVIAICCDISEMTPEEVAQYYDLDIEDDGNQMANVIDYLNDQTTIVGETDTTILFFNF